MPPGSFIEQFFADIDPYDLRNVVQEQSRSLDQSKKSFLRVNEVAEITPNLGDTELRIRKPGSNVLRLILSSYDIYNELGIHAQFAVFNDAGTPKVWIDGDIGILYATDGVFDGTITARAGSVAGWTIATNTLSSGSMTLNSATPALLMGAASNYMTGAGIFMGQHSATYKFHVGDPAGNNLAWDGSFLTANGQWIRAAGLNPSLTQWSTNIAFSSASDTQINWTSGTIAMQMSGLTYSISSGNTGAMAALTYIYLDLAISLTVLQKTTTYSTAVGDGKILIAAAQNATGGASVISYGGQQPIINGGAQITALSILAGNIAAGAVTASKISVTNLAAVNATMGALTIDDTLTMSGASANIRIGTTPPTSATVGTGLWIDRTGVFSLSSSVQNATLTSTGLSASAGNLTLTSTGIAMVADTVYSSTRSYKFVDGSGNVLSDYYVANVAGGTVAGHLSIKALTNQTSNLLFDSTTVTAAKSAQIKLTATSVAATASILIQALDTIGPNYIALNGDYIQVNGGDTIDVLTTGTFSPTVGGTGTFGTATYTTQLGSYYVIGKAVFVEINLTWTAIGGSPTGNLLVGGLPYTSANNSISVSMAVGFSNITLAAIGNKLQPAIQPNATTILFTEVGSAAQSPVGVDTAGTLRLSGWYIRA